MTIQSATIGHQSGLIPMLSYRLPFIRYIADAVLWGSQAKVGYPMGEEEIRDNRVTITIPLVQGLYFHYSKKDNHTLLNAPAVPLCSVSTLRAMFLLIHPTVQSGKGILAGVWILWLLVSGLVFSLPLVLLNFATQQ